DFSSEIAMGIGGHGEFTDTLARYGIVMGAPLLAQYYYSIKREREYVKYAGRLVDVKLFKAVDGVKEFRGNLEGLIDDKIVIVSEAGEKLEFNKKDVAATRLAVIF
ncbi:MAG: hypothetical protein Q4F63_01735, partial [Clostridia bacterium]|nr:hypothetical protein [Clostridia bacterium]